MPKSLNEDEAAFVTDSAVAIAEAFFETCGHLSRGHMALALLEAIADVRTTSPDLESWLVDEFTTAICSEVWRLKDLAESRSIRCAGTT